MSLPHNIHPLNTPWQSKDVLSSLVSMSLATFPQYQLIQALACQLPPHLFTLASRPGPRSGEEPACKKRRSRSLALSWQSHCFHWPQFGGQFSEPNFFKILPLNCCIFSCDACMYYTREFNMFEWTFQNYWLQDQETFLFNGCTFAFYNFITKSTKNVYLERFDEHSIFIFLLSAFVKAILHFSFFWGYFEIYGYCVTLHGFFYGTFDMFIVPYLRQSREKWHKFDFLLNFSIFLICSVTPTKWIMDIT